MVSGHAETQAGLSIIQTLPAAIIAPRLVIGEGVEEQRFFKKMLAYMNIEGVHAENYGGKPNLEKYLRALTIRSGHEKLVSVGITADADEDAMGTFTKVRNALRLIGLPEPSAHGLPVTEGIRVSVFVFPDGSSPGMLEDVCLASIRSKPEISCIDTYFACVKEKVGRQPHPRNMAKARVHAWLASHPDPDLRLAEAAEAGYWDLGNDAFSGIREFLRNL